MTDYVAGMSAAWHWFAARGRARHPRLRVVFAMLAGGAPLHAERLALRGGPAEAIHDPLVWFDTSSYGPRAIDAMLRMAGVDRLVHGTDRPAGRAAHAALRRRGGARAVRRQPRGGARVTPRSRASSSRGWRAGRTCGRTSSSTTAARCCSELLRNDDVAAWLICWMDEQDTGFHDHDVSAGAVAVVSGSVREDRLVLGAPPATRVVHAGGAFAFEASDMHRVRNAGAEPAVTLHAYSPPLWRMGTYEIQPGGRLLRHSVSDAEELRPLDAAA